MIDCDFTVTNVNVYSQNHGPAIVGRVKAVLPEFKMYLIITTY